MKFFFGFTVERFCLSRSPNPIIWHETCFIRLFVLISFYLLEHKLDHLYKKDMNCITFRINHNLPKKTGQSWTFTHSCFFWVDHEISRSNFCSTVLLSLSLCNIFSSWSFSNKYCFNKLKFVARFNSDLKKNTVFKCNAKTETTNVYFNLYKINGLPIFLDDFFVNAIPVDVKLYYKKYDFKFYFKRHTIYADNFSFHLFSLFCAFSCTVRKHSPNKW